MMEFAIGLMLRFYFIGINTLLNLTHSSNQFYKFIIFIIKMDNRTTKSIANRQMKIETNQGTGSK